MDILEDIYQTTKNFKATITSSNSEAHIILNTILNKIDSYKKESLDTKTPFTQRELEIFTLIAKGFTNAEVASALSISPKTIEFHLKNIYQKCEASGRSEAISIAISEGWLIP